MHEASPKATIIIMHVYEGTTNLADVIKEVAFSSGIKTEYKVEYMENNSYTASGQIGAMGTNASASNNVFNQIWSQHSNELDLPKLAADLGTLRTAMQMGAQTPDQLVAAGNIAQAEIEATKGNGPGALEHLKAAGQWALATAQKIGTEVAASAMAKVISGA